MAHITVPDQGIHYKTQNEIIKFLEPFGIWYEHWDVAGRIDQEADAKQILEEYTAEIEILKKRGGYVTADVINVTSQTPGLDEMLNRFNKEHTHSEDEVRFIVKGSGIFHIHPDNGPVFAIEMHPGDMINVPAGTRHWFDLCTERTIRAIRLFLDASGWTPEYIAGGVHTNYTPVCLGTQDVSAQASFKSVVEP